MSVRKTFVGFGFGAIQGGLFLYEAFRSGNFKRLVVAEVMPDVVAAVRQAGGYRVNIATSNAIRVEEVRGIEILNPLEAADAAVLADALAEASEIATALPSVEFYNRGNPSVAALIGEAIRRKTRDERLPRCIVYTAENHNHAAEILESLCGAREGESGAPASPGFGRAHSPVHPPAWPRLKPAKAGAPGQFLNTVIGKMSGVVTDPGEIAAQCLVGLAGDLPRAFLVEEFNRILISRIDLSGFQRGIKVFIEKPELLPFEEAKLYGHNAVHALLGYLAQRLGCQFMCDAGKIEPLMAVARGAFLEESGAALIARYQGLDPLFTPAGYQEYADDLLARMTNPHLRDRTERITRDTRRKLGWDDRLVGTMRLALDAGITPQRFALGAAAALETLGSNGSAAEQLEALWPAATEPPGRKAELIRLITEAQQKLRNGE